MCHCRSSAFEMRSTTTSMEGSIESTIGGAIFVWVSSSQRLRIRIMTTLMLRQLDSTRQVGFGRLLASARDSWERGESDNFIGAATGTGGLTP